jgi:hypothetical protein
MASERPLNHLYQVKLNQIRKKGQSMREHSYLYPPRHGQAPPITSLFWRVMLDSDDKRGRRKVCRERGRSYQRVLEGEDGRNHLEIGRRETHKVGCSPFFNLPDGYLNGCREQEGQEGR